MGRAGVMPAVVEVGSSPAYREIASIDLKIADGKLSVNCNPVSDFQEASAWMLSASRVIKRQSVPCGFGKCDRSRFVPLTCSPEFPNRASNVIRRFVNAF